MTRKWGPAGRGNGPLPEVSLLPESPGVYRFRDDHGRILYVGRARRLRRRVRSYWSDLSDRPRLSRMVPQIVRIEALVCASDHEACWLERNLLEHSRPRWNRALGGAEVPRYLVIEADRRTARIRLVHHPKEAPGQLIFGPYLGGTKVRLLAAALHRVHPIAYAVDGLTGAERDLGRIRGVEVADRDQLSRRLRAILDGRPAAVATFLDQLARRRDELAAQQSYELAGQVQEELTAAAWLLGDQRMATLNGGDAELYGWHDGVLLQLSTINGFVRRWQQRPCGQRRAAELIIGTPEPWQDFLQSNAELAAALS
ncbi:GIY-YIG nuclease family protein [Microlunatus elymi]|nr:GIY-YIG nuclease family protein [Microlunatus elymi]